MLLTLPPKADHCAGFKLPRRQMYLPKGAAAPWWRSKSDVFAVDGVTESHTFQPHTERECGSSSGLTA